MIVTQLAEMLLKQRIQKGLPSRAPTTATLQYFRNDRESQTRSHQCHVLVKPSGSMESAEGEDTSSPCWPQIKEVNDHRGPGDISITDPDLTTSSSSPPGGRWWALPEARAPSSTAHLGLLLGQGNGKPAESTLHPEEGT